MEALVPIFISGRGHGPEAEPPKRTSLGGNATWLHCNGLQLRVLSESSDPAQLSRPYLTMQDEPQVIVRKPNVIGA